MGYSLNKPNLRNMWGHSATCSCVIELLDSREKLFNFLGSQTGLFRWVFSINKAKLRWVGRFSEIQKSTKQREE